MIRGNQERIIHDPQQKKTAQTNNGGNQRKLNANTAQKGTIYVKREVSKCTKTKR